MTNNKSDKKTIGVIFGGRSAEHDVSIITAHIPIIESIIASGKFDVVPIYIAKDGSWYSDIAMNKLAYFKTKDFEKQLAKERKIQILFDDGLKVIWPGFRQTVLKIDVVFPAMHGTFGEDGSLPGLLRMAGVPFVGCDIFASAVAMDKVLTKQILTSENIPTPPYVWFTKRDWETNKENLVKKIAELKYPLFIKPVHLGSSIGITKVSQLSELDNAIEVGFHYDDKILVEEGVENLIEVTLPIMGNEELIFAGVEQPLNKKEFFDFEGKYLSGGKGKGVGVNSRYSDIPAKIDTEIADTVKKLGEKTYRALGCSGIARVDFLIDSNSKKVYVIEANPLPGSLYAHNWKTVGISGVDLVTKLIDLALERFNSRRDITYTMHSDILNKIGGPKIG